MEEARIIIVKGGIAGLAISFALHRKGIKRVVLERAEKVRPEGSGIITLTNGWRALDQLGASHRICLTSSLIHKTRTMLIVNGKKREFISTIVDEARCFRMNDLVEALVDAIPEVQFRLEITKMLFSGGTWESGVSALSI